LVFSYHLYRVWRPLSDIAPKDNTEVTTPSLWINCCAVGSQMMIAVSYRDRGQVSVYDLLNGRELFVLDVCDDECPINSISFRLDMCFHDMILVQYNTIQYNTIYDRIQYNTI